MLLELVNGSPPHLGLPMDQVCLNILTLGPPPLDEQKWSSHMRDFLRICLVKDPVLRPSADELMSHNFIILNNTEEDRERARQAFLKILLPFRMEKATEARPETVLNATEHNMVEQQRTVSVIDTRSQLMDKRERPGRP